MMDPHIKVTYTQCAKKKPLALIDFPGLGAEMRPEELQALGSLLFQVGKELESLAMDKRSFQKVQVTFDLREVQRRLQGAAQ